MTHVFDSRSAHAARESASITTRPSRQATRPSRALHELDSVWQRRVPVRAKLELVRPDDPLEHEADRVADQMLRSASADGRVQRACACGGAPGHDAECTSRRKKRLVTLHRGGAASGTSAAPSIVDESLRSPGLPLEPHVRDFFEPRFGYDFSAVRLHTDELAAESARALNAAAYTVGTDIVFAPNRYRPTGESGRRLLAHELTHVVQTRTQTTLPSIQRQLLPPIPIIVTPSTSVEVNAVDARQEPGTPWYAPWRYTGPIANFFLGDVTMTDIPSMVNRVIAYLRGRSMDRLNIMDHGNEAGVEIGDDWLSTPADVRPHAGTLGRLRSTFTGSGFVHMQNCNAGKNRSLICALSSAFGAPVYAGTGAHNPLLGFNVGDYVRCDPNGTFNPNAGRPSTPTHPRPGGPFGGAPDTTA